MANTYLDQTGTIRVEAVTPIIQALFGAYNLDATTPGQGDVYIASGTETANITWDAIRADLHDTAVSLGLDVQESDSESMPEILGALAEHFHCADDPFLLALMEEDDWEGDSSLSVLFELAKRFNDGHDMQYFKIEGAWTCNRPLLGQFGGYGEFGSEHYAICEDSRSIAELGLEIHKALINGDTDQVASLLFDQVTDLFDGIYDEDTMRNIRQKVAAKLAVLPVKKISAQLCAEQKGHTNMDSCTTLLSAMHDGDAFEFRICGTGRDAYFEWINELGIPVGDILDEIESLDEAKREFLAWLD